MNTLVSKGQTASTTLWPENGDATQIATWILSRTSSLGCHAWTWIWTEGNLWTRQHLASAFPDEYVRPIKLLFAILLLSFGWKTYSWFLFGIPFAAFGWKMGQFSFPELVRFFDVKQAEHDVYFALTYGTCMSILFFLIGQWNRKKIIRLFGFLLAVYVMLALWSHHIYRKAFYLQNLSLPMLVTNMSLIGWMGGWILKKMEMEIMKIISCWVGAYLLSDIFNLNLAVTLVLGFGSWVFQSHFSKPSRSDPLRTPSLTWIIRRILTLNFYKNKRD